MTDSLRAIAMQDPLKPGEPVPRYLQAARDASIARQQFLAEHIPLAEFALELQATREVALRAAQRGGLAAQLDGKWYVRRQGR
jgi:hypothetical protein